MVSTKHQAQIIIQHIVTLPKYGHGALNIPNSSSVVNRYSVYVISCVGEKNGEIRIVSNFSAIKLYFVINVLNNKTMILLNLAKYPLILANSAYGLLGKVYQTIA